MPMPSIEIQLPIAVPDADWIECARRDIEQAEEHILRLRLQMAHHELVALLADTDAQVQRLNFYVGSHYDDNGYSPHIVLQVEFIDTDGSKRIESGDDEAGYFIDEDIEELFAPLRDHIDNLPEAAQSRLSNRWIDCKNPSAMARQVMGDEGFALWEKSLVAAGSSPASATATRPRI